jgi:hypothetical protein
MYIIYLIRVIFIINSGGYFRGAIPKKSSEVGTQLLPKEIIIVLFIFPNCLVIPLKKDKRPFYYFYRGDHLRNGRIIRLYHYTNSSRYRFPCPDVIAILNLLSYGLKYGLLNGQMDIPSRKTDTY